MNTVIETILNRRSVRAYEDKAVSKEMLEAVIQAGIFAPSAMNAQPWHLTVVQDQLLLAEINQASMEAGKKSEKEYVRKIFEEPDKDIFYKAPVVIVVSAENENRWAANDCAAATQNMLLAAESLGLGMCWIGLARFAFENGQDVLIQKMQIPENFSPLYAVTLGHKVRDNGDAPERRMGTVTYL